ncbi:MAG TPA: hypothetical protein VF008_02600, partial [Niastella sp.]
SHNTADKHHLRGEGAGDFLKIFPPLSWPMGQESGGMPTLTQFKLHSHPGPGYDSISCIWIHFISWLVYNYYINKLLVAP